MFRQLTTLFGKGQDRGFTLIEMLIVILIIGILAAVGVPLYIGYTRDAKLAEAKALAGSTLTTVQACAETIDSTGANCTMANLSAKVGLSNTGLTGDGRWQVNISTVSLTNGANGGAATWSGGPITVTGQQADNNGLKALIIIDSHGVHMNCDTGQGNQSC